MKELADYNARPTGTRTSPEMRTMLTVPPEQVVERTLQLVGAVNLLMSLVLSGVVDYGLQPLKPDDFKTETKQNLALAYNAVGVALVTCTLCGSVFTGYIMMAVSTAAPSTLYLALARGGRFFVYYQYLTYATLFLVNTLVILASALYSTTAGVISTATIVVAITLFLKYVFVRCYKQLDVKHGPPLHGCAAGACGEAPGLERLERLEAPPVSPSAAQGREEGREELRRWLAAALPALRGRRQEDVLHAMLTEDLTVEALSKAATCEGGLQLVYAALELPGAAALTRGERLRLAAAAAHEGKGTATV